MTAVEKSGEFKNHSGLFYNFGEAETDWFNYFGIKYKTDSYTKGIIAYTNRKSETLTEEFFLGRNNTMVFSLGAYNFPRILSS